jgi:hypothetical protein
MLSFLADFKASSFLSSSSDFGSEVDASGVGVDVAAFPESFVASADGVSEGSDVVSELPDSPDGCVAEFVSPDVTGTSSLGVTGAGVAGSSAFGAGDAGSSDFGAVASVFGAEVSGCSVVPVFEVVSSVAGLDVAAFPKSFVASADGVLEGSAVVSELPVSPAGCVLELVSPDVTGASSLGVTGVEVESLGWVAVESPVGVVDGAPDSSE